MRAVALKIDKALHDAGWYRGGEFSGDSVDLMRVELAEETILKIHGPPL